VVFAKKNVFWFDVSVEDSISVHVVDGLDELVHVVLDSILGQVVAFAFNCVVHIHVHQLEDQGQTTGWLVVEDFVQLNDLRMGAQSAESLNFSEIVNLFDGVEMVFHALYCYVLAGFDALGFQDF